LETERGRFRVFDQSGHRSGPGGRRVPDGGRVAVRGQQRVHQRRIAAALAAAVSPVLLANLLLHHRGRRVPLLRPVMRSVVVLVVRGLQRRRVNVTLQDGTAESVHDAGGCGGNRGGGGAVDDGRRVKLDAVMFGFCRHAFGAVFFRVPATRYRHRCGGHPRSTGRHRYRRRLLWSCRRCTVVVRFGGLGRPRRDHRRRRRGRVVAKRPRVHDFRFGSSCAQQQHLHAL